MILKRSDICYINILLYNFKVSAAGEFQMGFQTPCHPLTGSRYVNYVQKAQQLGFAFRRKNIIIGLITANSCIRECHAGEWALALWTGCVPSGRALKGRI